MRSVSWLNVVLSTLAVTAAASSASAETKAAPAPAIVRPAPHVVKVPEAPIEVAKAPPKAVPATFKLAPVVAEKPVASPTAKGAPREVKVRRGPAPEASRFEIKPQVSDAGLKMSVDEHAGRIVVSGIARGGHVDEAKGEEFSAGISFEIDRDKMPDFSKDPDYTRKNAWYEAHVVDTSTRKGEAAFDVASRLADRLNKGGYYHAVVSGEGSEAVIHIQPARER